MSEQLKIEEIKKKEKSISELAKFRQEIVRLKREEQSESITAHFFGVEPQGLQEIDMRIYKKFKDGSLSPGEFKNYRDKLVETGNKDQRDFYAYLANKLTAIWNRE